MPAARPPGPAADPAGLEAWEAAGRATEEVPGTLAAGDLAVNASREAEKLSEDDTEPDARDAGEAVAAAAEVAREGELRKPEALPDAAAVVDE